MAEVKLTKNSLREQQVSLNQLNRYLPTLQLKKAMLQTQVVEVKLEIDSLKRALDEEKKHVNAYSKLLTSLHIGLNIENVANVQQVVRDYENIAGVDVPELRRVEFSPLEYSLFATPSWLDAVVAGIRQLVTSKAKVTIAEEKKAALEKELRDVSIRVNLFEKVLIPRAKKNIKRIKIFLGDQELAAVAQAKAAKRKILTKKAEQHAH